LISGLSDVPSDQLEGKTPLEAADVPCMDRVSRQGRIGLVETMAEDSASGSDKALLSLLGYDPSKFPIRRGPLEAAGVGVELGKEDLALRLNFVSTYNGILMDHNAGQISNAESASLIKMLNARFGDDKVQFFSGEGYRNVVVIRGGATMEFKTVPPHEAVHQPVVDFYPYGRDAGLITELLEKAHEELAHHDINRVRVDLGENPADRIWLWGEGADFQLPPFSDLFPLTGCVIGVVPLLKGIAGKIGFRLITPPGATGYVDTDYESKARYGLSALEANDLVIIHVGAVNEVCHQGNLSAKVRAIEEVDRRLMKPLIEGLKGFEPWRLMITTDHMTPADESLRLKWPVPMAFCGHGVDTIREYSFNETNAKRSDLFVDKGQELMEFFLGIRRT
jgi:2,3-bisphosphoglycerate-independent phosphoglycerate mutase